jgi:adenylate cyclase
MSDANEILTTLCAKPIIEKTRHYIVTDNNTWEIDEFSGVNQGLIVAELELSEIGKNFTKPPWLGMEVTHDLRYYNNNLVRYPFSEWQEN